MKGRECEMNHHIKKKWNKILSAILSLAIMLSCVPVQPIFAADEITFDCGNSIEIELTGNETQSKLVAISSFPRATEDDVTVESIAWSSTASGVVSVEETGTDNTTIIAHKAGTANITCTVNYSDQDENEENNSYNASITVTVKQEPVLGITATESNVTYPNPVTFNVTSEPGLDTTGQTVKFVDSQDTEILDKDGNPIAAETPCVLPAGTYDVYASVDATEKGVAAKSSTPASLTVTKGNPQLSITATKDPSAVDPGEVTFEVTSIQGLEAALTLTVKKVENGSETETITVDKKGQSFTVGNSCVLPLGTYKVYASVVETDNYQGATTSIDYTVNPVTPQLTVTATPSGNGAYPDTVTFGVTSTVDLSKTGQTPKLIVKRVEADQNETLINEVTDLEIPYLLPVGTYKAYVSVEATADGTYTESSNFITYTVSQGTPVLTVSAEPGTSVNYPGKVKFTVISEPDFSALEKEPKLVVQDAQGNAVKDNEGNDFIAGQEYVIPVGTYTVQASVEGSANGQYKGTTSTSIPYVVNQGTANWDIVEDDTSVYAGEEITIAFPHPKDEYDNDLNGTYELTLDNLTLNNLTGATSVQAGETVTLTAGDVGAAKLTVTFTPTDSVNYKSDITDVIDYTVNKIPVNVEWTKPVFEKTYDGKTSYTIKNVTSGIPKVSLAENFSGEPTELPGFTNTEYVFALTDAEGNPVSNVGAWTGTIAKESLILSDADKNVYEIKDVGNINVKVSPIKLTLANIDLSGVVATSKAYDASSEVEWSSNNPKFVYTNNIPEDLKEELLALKLEYTADYYDDTGNKVCGNPDVHTYPTEIRFDNVVIMQGSEEATNYVFDDNFAMPVITGTYGIQANRGLNDFVGLGLQEPVLDTFDDKILGVHWINANGTVTLEKSGFRFSENGSTAAQEVWADSYTVGESAPKRIYAKNESDGTISAGAYVALDNQAPDGQIYAILRSKNAEGLDVEQEVPLTGLKDNFDIIAGEDPNVKIVFYGNDAHSKIAKIEWYGTDEAWEENVDYKEKWKTITSMGTFIQDVEETQKDASVTEILQTVGNGEDIKELKRFYYARVTDYAGNVSYISSGGVLLDVTAPEAKTTLATVTNTFDGKNVYAGDVNFTVDLEDNSISSGIVSVEAVLTMNGREIGSYNTKTGNIWTASDNLTAINTLLELNSPTDSQIAATKGKTIQGTLTGLAEANGYTLSIVAVDKVGHRSIASEVDFIVDNAAPSVEVKDNRTNIVNNGTHFTGGSMTVTVTDYTLTTPVADLVTGIEDTNAQWDEPVERTEDGLITQVITLKFGEGEYYDTEGQYSFDVKAKDSMNREETYRCEEFTLDYTAPRYRVEYSHYNDDSLTTEKTSNGDDIFYYNNDITATFTIEDTTSYDDSKIKIVVKNKDDEAVMTWGDVDGDGNVDAYVKDSNYVITHADDNNIFEFKIDAVTAAEDDGYTYEISGTDVTGNVLVPYTAGEQKEVNAVRALDVTAPKVTDVAYSTDTAADATGLFKTVASGRDYINAPTTVRFTITEHNPTPNQYSVTYEGSNPIAPTWQQGTANNVYTSEIKVPMRGDKGDEQVVTYTIIDKAGNRAVLAQNGKTLRSNVNTSLTNGVFTDIFTVDTVQPVIKYEYTGYGPNRAKIDGIDYFKRDGVVVKVTVDEHNFNGLDTEVLLFNGSQAAGNNVSSFNETGWTSNGDSHVKTFTLTGDDKYDITVLGNDCADNALVLGSVNNNISAVQPETAKTTLSVAIDKGLPIISDSNKPTVIIGSPESTTATGNNSGQKLFNGDVTFEVKVYDPNAFKYSSGIDNVKFNIAAEDGTTSEAIVAKTGTSAANNGVNVILTNPEAAANLGRGNENVLIYNVTISKAVYNSNNIVLKVTAEDVATNSNMAEADPISIDTTAPEVKITYDNNDVTNLKYFQSNRTATIQVTERNFSDDCMTFKVNGSRKPLNFTLTNAGSGNRDDSVWEATYAFDVDDDYSITVECEDRAENVGNENITFEGEAPTDFTVDKVAPTYSITDESTKSDDAFVGDVIDDKEVIYHNQAIEIKFTIDEATSYDDTKITILAKNKDGDVVMEWKDGARTPENDANYVVDYTQQAKEFTFTVNAEEAAEDDGYTYEIFGTDAAGNVLVAKEDADSEELEKIHVLDVTEPELTKVAYSTEGAEDATGLFKTVISEDGSVERDYINAPTTMTFTIKEHHPTTNEYDVTEKDPDAQAPTWTPRQGEDGTKITDEYTSAIYVPMHGRTGDEQVITYTIIDKAGNRAILAKDCTLRSNKNTKLTVADVETGVKAGVFEDKYTVDTVIPKIEYEYMDNNPVRPGSVAGDGVDYFSQETVKVKVTVTEHNFNGLDTEVVLFNNKEEDQTEENQTPVSRTGDTTAGDTTTGDTTTGDTTTGDTTTGDTTTESDVSSATETEWESKGDYHVKIFTLTGDDQYDITVSGNDCANNALVLGQNTISDDKVAAVQSAEGETKLSVAIDQSLPIINDSAKPKITVSTASSTTASGTNGGQQLFGGNVTFRVTVYDPNVGKYSSGIDNVVIKVEADNGASSNVKVGKAGTSAGDNGVTVTMTNPSKAESLGRGLENKLEYDVTVSSVVYNSNNIRLKVTAEDVATNKSDVAADPFSIDTTPPKVMVTYDNNDVSNMKYFHDTRTATIQVTERNFSDDCMTFTVNGSSVPVSFTQTSSGSGNGDDSIWQATYPFENDDDYVVTGEVKDRINNVGTVEFEGQAAEDFIVDKTLPVMEIEFDNNNAMNENYFDAQRTATVIITEHNFNPDEVEIIGEGRDAGTPVSYPTLSGWSSSGDVHRATLNYSQDGLYTLDVEYTDLATNEAEDIEEEEFTIDNTDPEIIISGVEEQMPYSGEVRPEISFSDNNYDSHTVTMTRTERENIGVDVTEAVVGTVGVSIDGTGKGTGSRILEDIEHLEENDGIYTLTVNVVDKAGRSTEEMITYSVNRFGSVYVYSQDLVDMLNGYYQEIEGDLYITAYNANQLVNDSTKLEITCDGSVVENQNTVADVASARQATNGGWFEYRFRLDHDDFRKDGCYEITLSDKDEAGNTRTNSDAPVSFYIDATAPMIDSIIGLEESIVNANEHNIGYVVSDAIALDSVAVYVNGEQVNKVTQFENNTAFENTITLGTGMRQSVRIVVHDKAGNMVDTASESFTPAYAFNPEITVSTNFLVRWYANTVVFWSSVGAAVAVSGGAITAGVVRVRRKHRIADED